MPYERPTLSQLIERTAADLESRLPGTDPRLRRSLAGALARVQAGTAHGLYGYLSWVYAQILPDTCEVEVLDRFWGKVKGIFRRAPQAAAGSLPLTGVDGTVVAAGTVWQRADGAEFASGAEVTIAGGVASAPIVAVEAGAGGNTAAGSTLQLVSPVAGLDSGAALVEPVAGGSDLEEVEAYRTRVLDAWENAPQGGARRDYVTWAKEIPSVTRAWSVPQYYGAGSVGVFGVCDGQDPVSPTVDQVAEVQTHLEEVRPVTAALALFAGPTLVPLDPIIHVTPDTAEVRAAVEAELADLVLREGTAEGGTIPLSHVREAISVAAGEVDHELLSPVVDQVYAPGELPVLGEITWG